MQAIVVAFLLAVSYASANQMCVCNKMLLPVCGSDGKTYSNPCLLSCEAKIKPGLYQVYYGECGKSQMVRDPCVCTRELNPVCGSDGHTYPNPCMLNCEMSQNHDLTMAHSGECKTVKQDSFPKVCPMIWAPVCGSDGVTYPSMCNLNAAKSQNSQLSMVHHGVCAQQNFQAMDHCICTMDYRPVCGTDGKTYGNKCGLECAMKANNKLAMAYEGECRQVACPMIWAPVCGSDGKTYPSMCQFNYARSMDNSLAVAHQGQCETALKMARNMCICTREYMPVCGSDGKTYDNMCMFRCAAKDVSNHLSIMHEGECVENMKQSVPVCPAIWAPVCGSDGKTYPSMCQFNVAKSSNNGLTVAYHGVCQMAQSVCACTDDYRPVCGSDGKTYANLCGLRCQKQENKDLTVVYSGECTKPCMCTREYMPVCGSDGRTYGNMCTFNCQKSQVDGLTMSHMGEC